MQEYDIVIVGAGLIGASLIVALQNQGLKIAVVEKHLPSSKTDKNSSDRPISLSYASVEILRTLGVWESLSQYSSIIEQVQVSEFGAFGGVHFNAKEQGVDALGYVVPFNRLHLALYQKAAAKKDVSIIPIQEISRIEKEHEHVNISIETAKGQQQLKASLLIGCDGANSTVRTMLNIATKKKMQDKVATVATLMLKTNYPAIALERFSKDGVLAVLPLFKKNQCGLVWTIPNKKAEEIKDWSEQQYIDFISKCFVGRLPAIDSIKIGATFALQTITAKQQFVPGVLLLGNAAHTLYPLAAQGFNLGLRDVAALAEVLVEAKHEMKSLGTDAVLNKYVQWRKCDQDRISRLTLSIAKSFEIKLPFARHVRGLGLLMTDIISPLKNRVATLTLGLAGKLPKLVRGLPL